MTIVQTIEKTTSEPISPKLIAGMPFTYLIARMPEGYRIVRRSGAKAKALDGIHATKREAVRAVEADWIKETGVKTFEMNGNAYRTNVETLSVLRDAVESFRADGSRDVSAIAAIMSLGLMTGVIAECNDAAMTIDYATVVS